MSSQDTLRKLRAKSQEFENNKTNSINSIKTDVGMLINKLESVMNALITDTEAIFSCNPYALAISTLSETPGEQKISSNVLEALNEPVHPCEKISTEALSDVLRSIDSLITGRQEPSSCASQEKFTATNWLSVKPIRERERDFWNAVEVSWGTVTGSNVSYQLRMIYKNKEVIIYEGNMHCFSVRSLKPGTTYTFKARPIISERTGPWGNEVSITVPSVPPPCNLRCNTAKCSEVTLLWDGLGDGLSYEVEIENGGSYQKVYEGSGCSCTVHSLKPMTQYEFRARTAFDKKTRSAWNTAFVSTIKWDCSWKISPGFSYVNGNNKLAKREHGNTFTDSYILGDTPLPANAVTFWTIKVVRSAENNGFWFDLGVAQYDAEKYRTDRFLGWNIDLGNFCLYSCPPHNYREVSKLSHDDTVRTGENIGICMDTTKGKLSYRLFRHGFQTAFKDIPLDKPLVPCATLGILGDIIEIIT